MATRKKLAIPAIRSEDPGLYRTLQALKDNVEQITGVRGQSLTELASDASLSDVIAKVNSIITRLNAR